MKNNIVEIIKLSNKRILLRLPNGKCITVVPSYSHAGEGYSSIGIHACKSCAASLIGINGNPSSISNLSLCNCFTFNLCSKVGVTVNKTITRFKSVNIKGEFVGVSLYYTIYSKRN